MIILCNYFIVKIECLNLNYSKILINLVVDQAQSHTKESKDTSLKRNPKIFLVNNNLTVNKCHFHRQ